LYDFPSGELVTGCCMQPDLERMRRHWRALCEDIGERLAGTQGERRAAEYIRGAFTDAGSVRTDIATFQSQENLSSRASTKRWSGAKLRENRAAKNR